MPAHNLLPGGADVFRAGQIFVDRSDVAGHPRDVLRTRPVAGENCQDITERLRELTGEIAGYERLRLVPADDAAGEDHPAPSRNSVGIALWPRPARRLK